MALCWAVFEYFIKFHDTKGEMYLALSKKLRFLITEAVMQEEEEHSFLNARSDEDKAFLLALYRAAAITASATKFCPCKEKGKEGAGRRRLSLIVRGFNFLSSTRADDDLRPNKPRVLSCV